MSERRRIQKSNSQILVFSSKSLSLEPNNGATGIIEITTETGNLPVDLSYYNNLSSCSYSITSESNKIIITFTSTSTNTSTSSTKSLGNLVVNEIELLISQRTDYVISTSETNTYTDGRVYAVYDGEYRGNTVWIGVKYSGTKTTYTVTKYKSGNSTKTKKGYSFFDTGHHNWSPTIPDGSSYNVSRFEASGTYYSGTISRSGTTFYVNLTSSVHTYSGSIEGTPI